MAATNKKMTTKQKRSGAVVPSKPKNKWLPIIISVAVVVVGVVLWNVMTGGNMSERVAASQYLEKKYGKHFVVNNEPNPMVHRALGEPPKFDGRAYATDDPNLTFWVGRRTEPVGKFKDNFLGIYWAKQQREPVEKFLSTVFDTIPQYQVEIYPSDRIQNLPNGNIPDYNKIVAESGSELQYELSVGIKEKLTDKNRTEHLEKLLKLINYLKARGVGSPSVSYRLEAGRFDSYACSLFRDKLTRVTSTDDLKDCFERYHNRT